MLGQHDSEPLVVISGFASATMAAGNNDTGYRHGGMWQIKIGGDMMVGLALEDHIFDALPFGLDDFCPLCV